MADVSRDRILDEAQDDVSHLPEDFAPTGEDAPTPAPRPPFDLGKALSAKPVATAVAGVAIGFIAVVLLDFFTDRSRRRAVLEQSAMLQLRRAQRLEPFGDPLL